jgi:hypothetical protein
VQEPATAVTPAVDPYDEPYAEPYAEPYTSEPYTSEPYSPEPATAEQPLVPPPASDPLPSGATAVSALGPPTAGTGAMPAVGPGEPPMEEVEVTDLLLIVDLKDEVLVVDEHPRYHLLACPVLVGQETIPLPLDEARTDGFTPCGVCAPDSTLADRVRARKHGAGQ